jgi:K+-sensing histidine kinase KdpD
MQVESSMQRQNTSGIWIWLALCKNYIEDFGSEIEVKSEFGKWSNFSFKLKLI